LVIRESESDTGSRRERTGRRELWKTHATRKARIRPRKILQENTLSFSGSIQALCIKGQEGKKKNIIGNKKFYARIMLCYRREAAQTGTAP